ncbi:DinB family protein [Paenarthrobacter sp. Z7-10]|uniref:DinB family protein n=1 Tax=Paenarthrobacter sp. Z7-10 TaxID=2787635 RepID=UPI0022A8D9B4|nr:DinB family protein [Paenarthrobacter sp. Z7-10]MCZ2403167.1 DinB family protein [Paenarthrobacter sp. Z7-10]
MNGQPSTWTAPKFPLAEDGPLVGADRPILEGFLAWHRSTLLRICSGLTGDQLASRPVPPSALSLLGLVRHMAKVEPTWFRHRAGGQNVGSPYDPAKGKNADFDDLDPAEAKGDFERFDAECRLADEAAAALDFDDTFLLHGEEYSLRLVSVHMIAEYARHNGHADLLRECIDGTTGI